jgi:hypothetical protein
MNSAKTRMVELLITSSAGSAGTVTEKHRPGNYVYAVHAVEWIDGDFADGVDAVLSVVNTLSGVEQTILTLTDANSDAWYFPRIAESSNVGTPLTTNTPMLANGDLRLVVSAAGSVKTGGCIVYLVGP